MMLFGLSQNRPVNILFGERIRNSLTHGCRACCWLGRSGCSYENYDDSKKNKKKWNWSFYVVIQRGDLNVRRWQGIFMSRAIWPHARALFYIYLTEGPPLALSWFTFIGLYIYLYLPIMLSRYDGDHLADDEKIQTFDSNLSSFVLKYFSIKLQKWRRRKECKPTFAR